MIQERIYNFSSGPSTLPEEVLVRAQAELINYHNCGMSVLEMSHRSKMYEDIIARAEEALREVYAIPSDYEVLFLQGGATGMFAALPLNLAVNGAADFVLSGYFAKNAYIEGKKYLQDARIAASSEKDQYSYVPKQEHLMLNPKADFVHICDNNTAFGTRFHYVPDTQNIPLISDMSSNILSMPVDISKYGVIYAGAQKNLGIAGLTVVIMRKDLLGKASPLTPTVWDFTKQAEKKSLLNTPTTYAIYISQLVLDWIISIGGLGEVQRRNEEKAAMLYDYIDSTDFYLSPAAKEDRSIMNICFGTKDLALDAEFITQAEKAGLVNLKGHRIAGGMRASIYNAMPKEGVEALIVFMQRFAKENRDR